MKTLITPPILAFALLFSACKKLDEPVTGHFFVQNATEDYTLYINDVEVGQLGTSTEIPAICDDSLMMLTTPYEINVKRNDYILKDAADVTVASGNFKLGKSSFSSFGDTDFGGTYVWRNDNELIMGFNTPSTAIEETASACQE